MSSITFLVRRTALLLIQVLQILMLVMALMSWVPQLRESRIFQVISTLVEPVIAPFRRLLSMIPGLDRFPLDLSFMAAYLALSLLRRLL